MTGDDLEPRSSEPTVVEIAPRHQAVGVAALAVVGAGLGLVAPFVIGWADGRDWVPFQEQLSLLRKVVAMSGNWILVAAGAVLGGLVGLGLTKELSRVTVTDGDVTIAGGRDKHRFSRAQVTKVVIDGKHLVLRDDRDADLIRKKLDVAEADVRAALRQHDWPVG